MSSLNFDGLIFDLDGTLWDCSRLSTQAWNTLFQKHDLPMIQVEDLRSVTGKPFAECVATLCPQSIFEVNELIKILDEAEWNHLQGKHGDIYPRVTETLLALKKYYPLFIVSNCQAWYLENFKKHAPIGTFFKDFECIGNTKQPKSHNIKLVMQRNNLTKALYIGDTLSDFTAAKAAKIPFLQVTYGFGKKLDDCDKISSFDEILNYLQL